MVLALCLQMLESLGRCIHGGHKSKGSSNILWNEIRLNRLIAEFSEGYLEI